MPVSTMDWNPSHTHLRRSWWQYGNDRRIAEWTLVGLSIMAVIGALLTIRAVLAA